MTERTSEPKPKRAAEKLAWIEMRLAQEQDSLMEVDRMNLFQHEEQAVNTLNGMLAHFERRVKVLRAGIDDRGRTILEDRIEIDSMYAALGGQE